MMRVALLVTVLSAAAVRAEHTVTLGGFTNTTVASFLSSPFATGPTLGWTWTSAHFGVGAGLRVASPSASAPVPLEVYVRGVFTTRLHVWEPLLGPELGVSGLSGLARPLPGRATDFANAENAATGPLYVAFHTEVVRFRFGRFLVSAAGVDVGTSLTAAGTVFRLHFDVLSVGVRW